MTKIDEPNEEQLQEPNEEQLQEQLQELARKDAYARIAISKWLSHLAIQIEIGLVNAFDFRWSAQSLAVRPTGDVVVAARMMTIPTKAAQEAAVAVAEAKAVAEAREAEAQEVLKNLLTLRDYLQSVPVPTVDAESDAEKFRKFVDMRAPILVEELCENPDCDTCQARRARSA